MMSRPEWYPTWGSKVWLLMGSTVLVVFLANIQQGNIRGTAQKIWSGCKNGYTSTYYDLCGWIRGPPIHLITYLQYSMTANLKVELSVHVQD